MLYLNGNGASSTFDSAQVGFNRILQKRAGDVSFTFPEQVRLILGELFSATTVGKDYVPVSSHHGSGQLLRYESQVLPCPIDSSIARLSSNAA